MRHQLQIALLELSDIEFQRELWVKADRTKIEDYVGLSLTTENLLNNFAWEIGTELIGICLRNNDELQACLMVVSALENFLKIKPDKLSDAQYIEDDDWLLIIASARKALRILNWGDL
jgi:hypothetical protein